MGDSRLAQGLAPSAGSDKEPFSSVQATIVYVYVLVSTASTKNVRQKYMTKIILSKLNYYISSFPQQTMKRHLPLKLGVPVSVGSLYSLNWPNLQESNPNDLCMIEMLATLENWLGNSTLEWRCVF